MDLTGKVAIVTGGGRDIGSATALRLAKEGAAVAINYFSSSTGADETVAAIKAAGGKAFAMQGDLTKQEDCEALANKTAEEFGEISILVNNSGGLVGRTTIADCSLEHWNTIMTLNLTSTFLMIKSCLPHMKEGAIVNISSQAARDGGGAGSVPYATSKGAVMTLTRGLAKELGPNIRVNCVCPGMTDTDFHNIFTKDEARRGFEAAAPVKRQGRPDEIAALITFLAAGDDSGFMTGTNIDINGGMVFS